ncbi:response regulator transcription factor [Flammeovirga sp. MY04]|uniref:LytR/AlgR family response regulator transcription factor n=1 Tax=Flammeovirga sp. MY04 TaxID=1191459 RepID=UPI0008061C18|nr:LytTR family DNA-binding domain-containing protein [Flammeovirga sp. MY04]ANQ52424.1 response regulator transcription factor [Flammeovirga sp. MY04]
MKILIIEDEIPAQRYLKKCIEKVMPSAEFIFPIQSVEEGKEFFNSKSDLPDLIFSDIELSDGLSFDIYKDIDLKVPIIFVTAYNDYALRAFEVNSVDYLLKPINESDIEKSLEKFNNNTINHLSNETIKDVAKGVEQQEISFRQRIWVNYPTNLTIAEVNQIHAFQSENKTVFVHQDNGVSGHIDLTLDKLEKELDPEYFFRVNRQFIVNINGVVSIEPHYNGKWVLRIKSDEQIEIIIPKEKVSKFKQWMVK